MQLFSQSSIRSTIWKKMVLQRVTRITVWRLTWLKRNKAALTLLGPRCPKPRSNAIKDRYGEGGIPNEAKTGTGPILLTCSFPYVRDWLNEHPFKNTPEARLICNLRTGGPVRPYADHDETAKKANNPLNSYGSITNEGERHQLEFIIETKKWNPYCIRHSAITADPDYLPEHALKIKQEAKC